ncbi:hypothetical protein [Bacillus phage YungSlug]|nr:hypothetical protein [Bacillus phage YungSlug]
MANMRVQKSGGISFHLTPEEQLNEDRKKALLESQKEYERLNEEMKEKLAKLDEIINQHKKD